MMHFLIADTFTASLARLTGDEQKAAKTTAFDLQLNPASPGLSFHRVSGSRDPNFWSVRVNADLRIIVHRTASSLLLCYVDHHEPAYAWAERRKLETHPTTGAAQLVEVREAVREIVVPRYVEAAAPPKAPPLASCSNERLLSYGVPADWIAEIQEADEDMILQIAEHLPQEAGEALVTLAAGYVPQAAKPALPGTDPYAHPDAQRRFRPMDSQEELERALEYPWEKWAVFLHPTQRQMVEKDYSGPARVSGSAGTGKTIVALHRAVYLTRSNPDARVLLTTFSTPLANALHAKLTLLIHNEPRLAERLEVVAMDEIGRRLHALRFGKPRLATPEDVAAQIQSAAAAEQCPFPLHFLTAEWEQVFDAWQVDSWEEYRTTKRLGRRSRLSEAQRSSIWGVVAKARATLAEQGLVTNSEVFRRVAEDIAARPHPPFGFVVVDEAQDIGVQQLRFLAAIGGDRPNSLFFAGDLGQRIFQHPFSWKALGVDIRGRSQTLRVNYRTSHQIRRQADRLLDPEITDPDGNVEERRDTVSIVNGPSPGIVLLPTAEAEQATVGQWLAARMADGVQPHEIGVFVRSPEQFPRARLAIQAAGAPFVELDDRVRTQTGHVSLCTMHLAKGLEFRAVVVMACDDEVIPLQERIETAAEESELQEVYDTERHLLYVACTRARDFLLVTAAEPASEFLDDLG